MPWAWVCYGFFVDCRVSEYVYRFAGTALQAAGTSGDAALSVKARLFRLIFRITPAKSRLFVIQTSVLPVKPPFFLSGDCYYDALAAACGGGELHMGQAAFFHSCLQSWPFRSLDHARVCFPQRKLYDLPWGPRCLSESLVRVVVSAGEPVATLGSFWKLADDEVGLNLDCDGWRQMKCLIQVMLLIMPDTVCNPCSGRSCLWLGQCEVSSTGGWGAAAAEWILPVAHVKGVFDTQTMSAKVRHGVRESSAKGTVLRKDGWPLKKNLQ